MPKLTVNGIQLHYESKGEGEPILFVHGLGSSGYDWRLQVAYFSNRYRTVTFDLRGHGRSDKPPGPYSISLFTEDTVELIKALEIDPCHVVALSLGGYIAFQLAADAPELVRTLIPVNTAPELAPKTVKERFAIWQRFFLIRVFGMRRIGEFLSERLFPEPGFEEIRQDFIERWAANDRQAYLNTMRAMVGWSVRDRLKDLTMPVLVIASDGDYTTVASKEAYVELIPRGELVVVEDARHALPVEKSDVFNQTVDAFLSNLA